MRIEPIAGLLMIIILLLSGCLFSRNDEQKVEISIEGVQKYNEGYILIPALLYGFDNDDIRVSRISKKMIDRRNWFLEELDGTYFMNISLRFDIDISHSEEDPEPSYFRSTEFDKDADLHSLRIYLHMEKPQNLTVRLYSIHRDDYHWFESECTGFVGEGWNLLTVFYDLSEA